MEETIETFKLRDYPSQRNNPDSEGPIEFSEAWGFQAEEGRL